MELREYLEQVDAAYETLSGGVLEERLLFLLDDCRQTYGQESAPYASLLGELGAYCRGQGRYEESETYFRQALELLERTAGKESVAYATALGNLASVHRFTGQCADAEREYAACLALYRRTVGTGDVLYAAGLNGLSMVYLDQNLLLQAARLQTRAAEILESLPQCRDELAVSLCNLGLLLRQMGRLREAEEKLSRSVALFEGELGTNTPHYHAALNGLGAVDYSAGRYRQAQSRFRQAAQAAERLYGPDHWECRVAREHMELARRSAEAGQQRRSG